MITNRVKNYLILGLLALLLISGGLNIWQNKVRKAAEFQSMLDLANSNTLIAQKQGEISIRDSLISTIRRERQIIRSKDSVQMAGLKTRVAVLRVEIAKLPKEIPYQPDSSTIDSLRVSFAKKDSVIDTQELMIMNLETEKQGLFASFTREVEQLTDQRAAQVVISNQLQTKLVDEQGKTRKEVRKKKFFRTLSIIGAGAIGILLLKPN